MNCQATRPERAPRASAQASALARSILRRDLEAEMARIAVHHRKIFVLAAIVETQPQAEAVRQRNLFLHRFAGIDRGGALIVHHVARHQMAAV